MGTRLPASPSRDPGPAQAGFPGGLHRACLFALLIPALTLSQSLDLSDPVLARVETTYGLEARARVLAWRDLMTASRGLTEDEQLRAVNDFVNRLEFVDDAVHWKQPDYWATPIETLATGGGDCEDLAITKYFTLRDLGVPQERLRLTYVKALGLNQSHMVLTYFPTPEATPLVLDNLDPVVKPATERDDLSPVYSFNASGLWLARQRGAGKRVGDAGRLNLWRELLARIGRELR